MGAGSATALPQYAARAAAAPRQPGCAQVHFQCSTLQKIAVV